MENDTQSGPFEAVTSDGASAELEQWIDANCIGPDDVGRVVERLARRTVPPQPWHPSRTANPVSADFEEVNWPWNRAAGNLVERGFPGAALEVWSAHYLVYLSLQQRYYQRYPKGGPLCNIGYALAKVRNTSAAAKSWLLGLAEDALTDPAASYEQKNYLNLRRVDAARAVLGQVIRTVESRFLDQAIVPLLPECAIELCLQPGRLSSSEECFARMSRLLAGLAESYPELPSNSQCWALLNHAWAFADWSVLAQPGVVEWTLT